MQKLDLIALAVCLALACPNPALGEPWLTRIEQAFANFARRKVAALGAIGAASVVTRLALLRWMPVPEPKGHDEFSYLLAADTFAHGHLANPPHPLSVFFETFHVIQHPTYASIYPPAQGLVLAIGHVLGHPWIGVLLSTAAMCMAITWMLQGWTSAEWAFLGGALTLLQVGLFSYWVNSYWGGTVAATGGALILGALARIFKLPKPRDAVILGLGASILATSRPLEGFLFCLPVGGAILWWCWRGGSAKRRARVTHVLLPVALVVACAVAFVTYYNWRVTANPLVFPHMIERQNYITSPIFVWEHDKPRLTYTNPQFDNFYNHWMPSLYRPGWAAAVGSAGRKSAAFWKFFLGPAFSLPLLTLPWLLRDRGASLLLFQLALSALGLFALAFFQAHYAAPLLGTTMILVTQGLRQLRRFRVFGRPVGVGFSRLVVLFTALIGPVYLADQVASWSPARSKQWDVAKTWASPVHLLALTTALLALSFAGLRRVQSAHPSATATSVVAPAEMALLGVVALLLCVGQGNLHPRDFSFVDDEAAPFRKPVEQQLDAIPGQHLVLVRYGEDHDCHLEYVFNEADIDHARIVWAREIPSLNSSPLLDYFRNRDVWVFQPDVHGRKLLSYPRENLPR